jgi:glutamyl-tRNA synthetase
MDALTAFGEDLDTARDLSITGLDALARAFAEKSGWSTKELFMLLRLAATGKKATPPLFETLAALGRELCRRRIRQCTEYIKKMPAPKA